MTQTAAPSSATSESAAIAPVSATLWTKGFTLLCVLGVLCYFANYMVGVVLPFYVKDLGGDPVITGLIFTSFSTTSFILRPLIGHLSDAWSVRGTIGIGAGLLGTLALVFTLPWLWLAFIANGLRGIGWGAFSAGSSTAVALLAPPARRAEASGMHSIAGNATAAFAPAFGLWLLQSTGNFTPIFVLASLAGIGALILLLTQLPRIGEGAETLRAFRQALTLHREGFSVGSILDTPVLLASLLLVCVTLTAPVTFAFVPLHAASLGLENISLYFIAAGVTSIGSRLLLGRFLDQGSRGFWMILGYTCLAGSFGVLIFATGIEIFMLAAVLSALGRSFAEPSMSAFAMDRAASGRMGKAMATYSMFYRVGEGIGAPLAGTLIVLSGYPGMYVGAMAIILTGVMLVTINWGTVGRPNSRLAA
jgi:MFS family permease